MSSQIRLSIPAMKCDGCVKAIEKALGEVVGDTAVDVDLPTRMATVGADAGLPELVSALQSAGFEATEVAAEGKDMPT